MSAYSAAKQTHVVSMKPCRIWEFLGDYCLIGEFVLLCVFFKSELTLQNIQSHTNSPIDIGVAQKLPYYER